MRVWKFDDPTDTPEVNALIHDKWFPLSRIYEDGGDLVIPFAAQDVNRADKAVFDSELRIHDVRAWRVEDPEQVEIYDFAGLTFDHDRSCIRVEGNIPVTVGSGRRQLQDHDREALGASGVAWVSVRECPLNRRPVRE